MIQRDMLRYKMNKNCVYINPYYIRINALKGLYKRFFIYEYWWRWGELNPRPKTFSQEVYMFSKGLLS